MFHNNFFYHTGKNLRAFGFPFLSFCAIKRHCYRKTACNFSRKEKIKTAKRVTPDGTLFFLLRFTFCQYTSFNLTYSGVISSLMSFILLAPNILADFL